MIPNVTFEYLLQAAFVGEIIFVVYLDPARSYILRAAEQGEAGLSERSMYVSAKVRNVDRVWWCLVLIMYLVCTIYSPAYRTLKVYKKVRINVSVRLTIKHKTVYRVCFAPNYGIGKIHHRRPFCASRYFWTESMNGVDERRKTEWEKASMREEPLSYQNRLGTMAVHLELFFLWQQRCVVLEGGT